MKKYLKYILIFLFLVGLFFLSPISGDDWSNYLVGEEGIRHSLGVALGMYFDWEGRLISRVFINLLTYNKVLWNIVNSCVVTGIIFIGMKFINKPKKYIFPLMVLTIFGMNLFTFSQVITWLAGNITYLFVVPVILWYFYYVLNNDKYNKWFVCLFSLINIFGCMFVENMAIVLVCGNILLLIIKYIKNKKIDKRLILYLVLSILGTLLMLLSPGTRYRNSVENIEFNKLNILEKVFYNMPNFVYYTFIVNSFMLVLMSFSNYFIIRDKVKSKWLKYSLVVFMLSVCILTIMIYPISMISDISLIFLINQTNWFIIGYWILYLIISFVLIVIYDWKDYSTIFLFLVGLLSNCAMLLSPTWGFRTSFFTYLMFSIVALKVINSYVSEKRLLNYSGYVLMGCACLFYLVFYINIFRCQNDLEKSISRQLRSDEDIIYITSFPSFANCNINPGNDYHINAFKKYYGIPDSKQLVLVDGKWKYEIFYRG